MSKPTSPESSGAKEPEFALHVGDALTVLRTLPEASVDCCVTSPPYWGLRDYAVEGQIGLEPSPAAYVEALVTIFAEVRRVLRPAGTLWLNLGDTYNSNPSWGRGKSTMEGRPQDAIPSKPSGGWLSHAKTDTLKSKDLVGIPWRVAFALQDDGWYLRADNIWSKPNPMPESALDRPSRSHEYVFLLSKSERYWFDVDAISEPAKYYGPNGKPKAGPHSGQMQARAGSNRKQQRRAVELAVAGGLTDAHIEAIRAVGISDVGKALTTTRGAGKSDPEKQRLADEAKKVLGGYYREFLIAVDRRPRTVWTIQTQQYADAHFAVYPEELPRRCILAGCPKDGVVLDPFLGSGTTARVARQEGRRAVGVELNEEYAALAEERVRTYYKRPVRVRPADEAQLRLEEAAA